MSVTKISKNGIEFIKRFEGCRLSAYKDEVGVWTIGYGITNADTVATGLVIKEGAVITQKDADYLLKEKIEHSYNKKVAKYDSIYHFNQNQFDALVDFAYSVGSIDQLTQNGSRSLKEIGEKILLYNKIGGKILVGLDKRRRAEKELFEKEVEKHDRETVLNDGE
jgi:GH24 family phage-related lysozyme (muramidase)